MVGSRREGNGKQRRLEDGAAFSTEAFNLRLSVGLKNIGDGLLTDDPDTMSEEIEECGGTSFERKRSEDIVAEKTEDQTKYPNAEDFIPKAKDYSAINISPNANENVFFDE